MTAASAKGRRHRPEPDRHEAPSLFIAYFEGPPKLECYDRIAAQMTELALEPIRLLRQRTLLAAVTSRALCDGRRFHITVGKEWPAGPESEPVYRWEVTEVGPDGRALASGVRGEATYDDPEDAYWAAVESLGAAANGTGQAARS